MNKDKFWNDLKSGEFALMVHESSKKQMLSSSIEVYNVLKPLFVIEPDIEKMYFIFLDQKNNIISIENLFRGSIASTTIYPREVLKRTISLKANNVIMSHNHPSGDPYPSKQDISITKTIIIALRSIDVTLLDHIIIGEGHYSMTDQGIMKKIKVEIDNFMNDV